MATALVLIDVINDFFDPVGRFPKIEENVKPVYLLYNDYAKYYAQRPCR